MSRMLVVWTAGASLGSAPSARSSFESPARVTQGPAGVPLSAGGAAAYASPAGVPGGSAAASVTASQLTLGTQASTAASAVQMKPLNGDQWYTLQTFRAMNQVRNRGRVHV